MSSQTSETSSASSSTRPDAAQHVVRRVESTDTLYSTLSADEGGSQRGSRMTRSQLALPGPEPVSEFKRVRTKFTVEQIRELEALFTVHGPHPSREQRLAVAEKINVPPRTVQVFLQNRRQRDTKNQTATKEAEVAKKEAKEGSQLTATDFNFIVPRSADVDPSSQKELSVVTNMLKSKLSRPGYSTFATRPHYVPDHSRSIRPCTTSVMSLDNVATKMESIRPSHEWKENIPSSDPLSSPITEPISLDEQKSSPLLKHVQFTPPPPTTKDMNALWTRMISSPPTPLSPSNRRDDWRRISRVKSAGKQLHNLELACALSRGGDRRSEEKDPHRMEPSDAPPRSRTSSFQKRLREDSEKEVPRKRASILDFHQAESNACPKPKAPRNSEPRQITRGFETDSSGGTTTGDELGTPDDSIATSSPSIASMSLVTRQIEEGQLEDETKSVDMLTEREADAAMVLASLFGQA